MIYLKVYFRQNGESIMKPIEDGLKGRDRLEGYDVDAVITYPGK